MSHSEAPLGGPPPVGTLQRLKAKWGVPSTRRVLVIMVVFSLAGSSILWMRKFFFGLLGFTTDTSAWITVPTYLLIMVPTYQVFLLVFGTLLGEFQFFWEKEKKFARLIARPFRRKTS